MSHEDGWDVVADVHPPTARQTHATGPQGDGHRDCACSDRPTSTEPVDDRTRARYLERINLAESHARTAHNLADNSRHAPLVHAHLAQFWLDLAKEQRP